MKLKTVTAIALALCFLVPMASASNVIAAQGFVRTTLGEKTCFATLQVTISQGSAAINILPTTTGTAIDPDCQLVNDRGTTAVTGVTATCTPGAVISGEADGVALALTVVSCHSSQPRGYADATVTLASGRTAVAEGLAFAYA